MARHVQERSHAGAPADICARLTAVGTAKGSRLSYDPFAVQNEHARCAFGMAAARFRIEIPVKSDGGTPPSRHRVRPLRWVTPSFSRRLSSRSHGSYADNSPLSTSPTVFRITASSKSPRAGSPVRENAVAPQWPFAAASVRANRIAWSELRTLFRFRLRAGEESHRNRMAQSHALQGTIRRYPIVLRRWRKPAGRRNLDMIALQHYCCIHDSSPRLFARGSLDHPATRRAPGKPSRGRSRFRDKCLAA